MVAAREAVALGDDLAGMQRRARTVLHVVDPSLVPEEPASRYGVRRAVIEARSATALAFAPEASAPDVLRVAAQVETAAQQVEDRLATLVAVAGRIAAARTAAEAAAETAALRRLAEQVVLGADDDGDGRVTLAPGEPGLVQWRIALRTLLAHRQARSAEVPR